MEAEEVVGVLEDNVDRSLSLKGGGSLAGLRDIMSSDRDFKARRS